MPRREQRSCWVHERGWLWRRQQLVMDGGGGCDDEAKCVAVLLDDDVPMMSHSVVKKLA